MATSGYILTTYVDAGLGAINAIFSWKRTGYSIADNTSTIYWTLSLVSAGDAIIFGGNKHYKVQVRGKTYEGEANINVGINQTKQLASGQETFTHLKDGSLSFSFNFSIQKMNKNNTAAASGSATLDTIPRPATIVSAEDFNDEENPTIYYNNVSGGLVDALEACISFTGGEDDVPYRAISKTGDSYTFELTETERETLRNAIKSGNNTTVRFYVRTRIGNYTEWSYLTKTISLINYEPILEPVIKDTNIVTTRLTGNPNKFIRNFSDAEVIFNAIALKGATIKRKSVTNGSQTKNINVASMNSTDIYGVDGDSFYLSATDSRGYTTSKTIELNENFIPYFSVTCNQTIRLNLDGTIAMTVTGKYYNEFFGALRNTLKVETRHREVGGAWSAWGDITPLISDIDNDTYTLNTTISGYDPSGTYEFQCRAFDELSTANSSIDAITLKPIFDWGKYDFNFNVPLTIEDSPLVDFVIEEGTEAMGTNGTWYWRKWKNGRAECYGCRNYGNMAVTTDWGGWFRSGSFSQDLPAGLFVSTPEVIDISLRQGSSGGWVVRFEYEAPSDYSTGSFVVVRPKSATISQAYISFNIIGRWK
jgi:hypothetical protein